MRTKNILALILSGLLIVSCQEKTPQFEKTILSFNNQKVEILTAFKLFDNYLVKSKTNTNIIKASRGLVYDPVKKEIIGNAEAAFLFNTIKVPYKPNEYLQAEIDALRSVNLITIIKEVLIKVTSTLPGPDTKIIILPASEYLRETFIKTNFPISGITIGTGKIIMMIDPTFENWIDFLPYCIAHEYHHSTWISRNWMSSDFSLIEYLTFEGRADMFASDLYENFNNPLTKILSQQQERQVWQLIENEIFEKGHARIKKVMFGDDMIPFASGYTIGFNIVKYYKQKNPTVSNLDLIDKDPKLIFGLSGYIDSLTEEK